MLRKYLAVGIILLFVVTGIIPIEGSLLIEKEQSIQTKNCSYGIILNGTMGENGWYVSHVQVILDFPSNRTYYKIDQGSWQEYTGPFEVTTDGLHNVSCYYVDNEGHQSDTYYATFQIDYTAPTITLIAEKICHNKYRIYAEVSDATSGVNRVEFFLNDYLIYTDYEAPYEWIYKGPSFNPEAIAYDKAGNSAMPSLPPPDQITYFAIGFINNPQFNEFGGTFFAEFVIVIEHNFHALLSHISTLTHQQFAFDDYKGYISENFMIVKAKAY